MRIPIVQLSWDSKVSKIAPIGISSGIDVGFSNWGLELVNVSLYVLLILNINSLICQYILKLSISGTL